MDINTATVATSSNQGSYRAIFDRYVTARAKHLLECTQQADFVRSSNDQKRLLQTLQYSLHCPDSWSATRDLVLAAAPLMQRAGYRDEWIPYLQTGIEKSAEYNDLPTQARLNYELGFIYQNIGQLQDAQTHYEVGISKIERGEDLSIYAKVVNKLAFVKRLQQLHDESEQIILELLPQLDATEPEYGTSHLVLGWIAFDKLEWAQSEDNFRKALGSWDVDNNPFAYASGLRDIASVLLMQQKYDESIRYYLKAIQVFEKITESHQAAVTVMNLGICYIFTQQPQQALEHFFRAEAEFRRVQDLHHISLAYLNMGIAYRALAQLDVSINKILSAISIWERIGSADMLVNMLDELGVSYTRANRKELAISTFTNALEYLPEIIDERVCAHYRQEVETHLEEVKVHRCTSTSGQISLHSQNQRQVQQSAVAQ